MFIWILIGYTKADCEYPPWNVRTYRSQERAEADRNKLNEFARAQDKSYAGLTGLSKYGAISLPGPEWKVLDPYEHLDSNHDIHYEIERIEYVGE